MFELFPDRGSTVRTRLLSTETVREARKMVSKPAFCFSCFVVCCTYCDVQKLCYDSTVDHHPTSVDIAARKLSQTMSEKGEAGARVPPVGSRLEAASLHTSAQEDDALDGSSSDLDSASEEQNTINSGDSDMLLIPADAVVETHDSTRKKQPLVLWVDDCVDQVDLWMVWLQQKGFDVAHTSSTSSALTLLQHGLEPDVIITDMGREEFVSERQRLFNPTAGLLLTEEIRKTGRSIPIFFGTTEDNVERYLDDVIRVGGNGIFCCLDSLLEQLVLAMPMAAASVEQEMAGFRTNDDVFQHCQHCQGTEGEFCSCTQNRHQPIHCSHCRGLEAACQCAHACEPNALCKCYVEHAGVYCSTCCDEEQNRPIRGTRYKCISCSANGDIGINLCAQCYDDGKHDLTHAFEAVPRVGSEPAALWPRSRLSRWSE